MDQKDLQKKQIKIKLNKRFLSHNKYNFLIIILLILSLGMAYYIYDGISQLNEQDISLLTGQKDNSETLISQDIDRNVETTIEDSEDADIIEEGGLSVTRDESQLPQNITQEVRAEATAEQWIATDYELGDITGGSYTVKYGDTLWEISEAVYGRGFEWRNLLAKNADKVGFLPNGQQALIFPGQVLEL